MSSCLATFRRGQAYSPCTNARASLTGVCLAPPPRSCTAIYVEKMFAAIWPVRLA